MNLLDFIFLGFVLITVLIGITKGFAKMISNSLCVILALVGAVALSMVLTNVLKETALFTSLCTATSGWFAHPLMTTQITSEQQLVELLTSTEAGAFSILAGISEPLFKGLQTAGVDSLGGYFGNLIANVIFAIVIWLVSYLILKYALFGIKKLLRLLAGLPIIKSLDKVAGVLVSVAFGYLIVVGVLYPLFIVICANFAQEIANQVLGLVNTSALFKFVHHSNFLGQIVCDLFQVDYITFGLIG